MIHALKKGELYALFYAALFLGGLGSFDERMRNFLAIFESSD
jgi:hypothetical protein